MILFFSVLKLEALASGTPEIYLKALEFKYFKETIPKNSKDKYLRIKGKDISGSSFILNFEPLLNDIRTDILYKVQYIRLAGRRNYLDYKTLGIKHLDLNLYMDINIENIKHNPLLNIQNNRLHFKYEEL